MGDFAADFSRALAISSDRPYSARAFLRVALLDSELHCVACYRFGQFSQQVRAKHALLGIPLFIVHRIWNRWVSRLYQCEISAGARIGPGLVLMHRMGVIVDAVTIGRNCTLHQNVTIGQRVARGDQGLATIGDDVWIGPGSVLAGAITVGDGVAISAGTILSRDVPAHCLVGGNPGRVLAQDYDINSMGG